MPPHSSVRVAASLGLALLLVLSVAGPALACDPRLSDLRDSRSWPDAVDGQDLGASSSVTRTSATRASATRSGAAAVPQSDITPGRVNRTSLYLSATYQVGLRLSYATRSFQANTVATIRNSSSGPIDRVELNTIAARLGGMRLLTVRVDGRPVRARVSDQTVIVPLGGVLAVGDTVQVRVHYTARLRTGLAGSNWMFTKANGIVDAYRWIPWVSRTTAFNRPNHGDPFVTPVSPLVKLRVDTDRRLVIASSGNLLSRSADGRTQRFEARNVRDVTFTAAPDFRTMTRTIGSTTIRYYYRNGANAAYILSAATSAFRSMRARLGAYPYPVYKVVQSAGGYGMESPGMTWIPYGHGRANLRYLVYHETAHQWFYGLVGNDQARQPFADEAMADFVARDLTGLRRSSRCSTGRLDLSIYRYSSGCYYEIVYIQGGNLINQARLRMGSTLFWSTLRSYIAGRRYGLARTQTLLQTLDAATPSNLSTLFRPRFPAYY
jgi:hypothetical protein